MVDNFLNLIYIYGKAEQVKKFHEKLVKSEKNDSINLLAQINPIEFTKDYTDLAINSYIDVYHTNDTNLKDKLYSLIKANGHIDVLDRILYGCESLTFSSKSILTANGTNDDEMKMLIPYVTSTGKHLGIGFIKALANKFDISICDIYFNTDKEIYGFSWCGEKSLRLQTSSEVLTFSELSNKYQLKPEIEKIGNKEIKNFNNVVDAYIKKVVEKFNDFLSKPIRLSNSSNEENSLDAKSSIPNQPEEELRPKATFPNPPTKSFGPKPPMVNQNNTGFGPKQSFPTPSTSNNTTPNFGPKPGWVPNNKGASNLPPPPPIPSNK